MNKEFLYAHPLQIAVFETELPGFEKALLEVNQHMPLNISKKDGPHDYAGRPRYIFSLVGTTINFAEAYCNFGSLFYKYILSKRKI